jgi:hypothetical protein
VGKVLLVTIPSVKHAVTRLPMQWHQQHPSSFHAALLVVLCLIAMTFEPLYPLAAFALATVNTTINFTALTLTATLHR